MPRRHKPVLPGYAPGSGLALRVYEAKGRTKGIAQKVKGTSTAGHSHRRTSSGKAEPESPITLEAKLKHLAIQPLSSWREFGRQQNISTSTLCKGLSSQEVGPKLCSILIQDFFRIARIPPCSKTAEREWNPTHEKHHHGLPEKRSEAGACGDCKVRVKWILYKIGPSVNTKHGE
jgi:hypothetical protein